MGLPPTIQLSLHDFALLAILGPDTCIQSISGSFLRFLNREYAELIGSPFMDVLSAERPEKNREWLLSKLKSGRPWRGDFRYTGSNGQVLWIDARFVPVMKTDGTWESVHLIAFDISDRKKIEIAQRRSLGSFSNILNRAPAGVFIADSKGSCTFVNQSWMRVAGGSLIQSLGDGWLKRVHPQDRESVQQDWQTFVQGGKSFAREFRYQESPDKIRTVYAHADYVESSDGRLLLRLEEDITPMREEEKRTNHQRAETFQSLKMSSLFHMAGNMAHEINNPAAVIKARSEKILRSLAAEKPDLQTIEHSARAISDTVERIAGVIRSLIHMTQSSTRETREPVCIEELSQAVLTMTKPSLAEKGVRLDAKFLEEKVVILGSASSLGQVLGILLKNAHDAVDGMVDPWIRLSLERQDGRLIIRVEDSGPGIPTDQRDRIFEPFFTTKDPGKGMGLGLCTARSMIQNHQGSLELRSDHPHTCFEISLPIA